jgi:O-antigen/teichoic acid export membrane protein
LHVWGAAEYGQWLTLNAIPAYLSISDFGLGTVAANDMTMKVAAGNLGGARNAFTVSWMCVAAITLVIGSILIPLVFMAPWTNWLDVTAMGPGQAKATLAALAIYALVTQNFAGRMDAFRSFGRYALGNVIKASERLGEFGAIVVALAFHAPPLIVAGSMLAVVVACLVAVWISLYVLAPWLREGGRRFDLSLAKAYFRPSAALILYWLSDMLMVQGLTIVIAVRLGPVVVAGFNTLRTLSRVPLQLSQMISWAFVPELAASKGAGDLKSAQTLAFNLIRLAIWGAAATSILLFLLGDFVYRNWTLGRLSFDKPLFSALLLIAVANGVWTSALYILIAFNAQSRVTAGLVSGAVVSFGLVLLLVHTFGIWGIPLVLLPVHLLWTLYVTRIAAQLIDVRPKTLFGSAAPTRALVARVYSLMRVRQAG